MSTAQRFTRLDTSGKAITDAKTPHAAVCDLHTGLIWSVAEIESMPWKKAIAFCKKLKLCGKKDWRLPSCDELLTIVDRGKCNPAIDSTAFPDCKGGWYWSSTPYVGSPGGYAWVVNFYNGSADWGGQDDGFLVRAVRSSQS